MLLSGSSKKKAITPDPILKSKVFFARSLAFFSSPTRSETIECSRRSNKLCFGSQEWTVRNLQSHRELWQAKQLNEINAQRAAEKSAPLRALFIHEVQHERHPTDRAVMQWKCYNFSTLPLADDKWVCGAKAPTHIVVGSSPRLGMFMLIKSGIRRVVAYRRWTEIVEKKRVKEIEVKSKLTLMVEMTIDATKKKCLKNNNKSERQK